MQENESYFKIFLIFLRIGLLAWGGPVAQIAMIREELVEQKGWVSTEKFNRVFSIYQALPGPEAHELCVYFGMVRKGRLGGFLAGLAFMLPGFLLILLLSWGYTTLGATVLLPLFIGVAPAVAALIVRALHRIGQHTLLDKSLWLAAAASVALTLLNVHFLLVLIICAVWRTLWAKQKRKAALFSICGLTLASLVVTYGLPYHIELTASSSGGLFIEGLKAGLLSFGGAYTAIPFLEASMVDAYPTVTSQTFLDGLALSNVIPAPLVIFGTYLGFLADGFWGAILITLGIFLPAFSFTLIGHEWLNKAIDNPALHGLLDGVAAGVVGLLAITTAQILIQTVTGVLPLLIFCAALLGLYRLKQKWSVPAVILFCGMMGLFLQ